MQDVLDLGMQPIANEFTEPGSDEEVPKIHLVLAFDEDAKRLTLRNRVVREDMFNDRYVYRTSMSQTMREHFEGAARWDKSLKPTGQLIEVGSNDVALI